jgi:hypothetical protein
VCTVTSQLPPAQWHEHIGDATLADAICFGHSMIRDNYWVNFNFPNASVIVSQ